MGETKKTAKKTVKRTKSVKSARKTKTAQSGVNWLPIVIVIGIILVLGVGAYFFINDKDSAVEDIPIVGEIADVVEEVTETDDAQASRFGDYKEIRVSVNPKVPSYSVDEDLSNVINASDFNLSDESEELLVKNAFVVVPGNYYEFFSLYENNRYSETPSFITTDAVLHNYHLMFNHLLEKVEKDKLIPELKDLDEGMFEASLDQYKELKGTDWENAALRNVGFFAVASKLMGQDVDVPDEVSDAVEAELNLIDEHAGITVSPLMNFGEETNIVDAFKEDYSQYIPRGHYDKTEELKEYFKAMMWYGRMTFRFKEADETKSAILMTLAMDGDNLDSWERIYEPTNFFVGKSDDVTYYDVHEILEDVYGKNPKLDEVAGNEDDFEKAYSELKKLDPPEINSIPIFEEEIQPDREKEIHGFRFMGQRYTIDASIFQRLIDREVKDRMLPKGLDIPAAMGSDEALDILDEMGETKYKNYEANMSKMRTYISGLAKNIWTQNLYWSWMYALRPLLEEKGDGYPAFMQNTAWLRKELNTYLGSWTELKHDTILYAKQVYAELGGAPEDLEIKGYVEPYPEVYARVAALCEMTREGLEDRDLIEKRDSDTLESMEELVRDLLDISIKELENKTLSKDDYDLIRTFGGQLEHFWMEALRDEGVESISQLANNPAALVADVATDPNGQVLEEATGYINNIYVAVPIEGDIVLAQGGVFSQYEFVEPLSGRLTDSEWQDTLESGDAPNLASWMDSFVGTPAN